jgi:hypothetical protein
MKLTPANIVIVIAAALTAGCSGGSTAGGPGDQDGGTKDAATSTDASGSGRHADAGRDGAPHSSGSVSGTPSGSGSTGDTSSGSASSGGSSGSGILIDAGSDACSPGPDGGHYVALAWNESCGQNVTAFEVAWGRADGGPYPSSVDAGFSCDAGACEGGSTSGQLSCHYNLRNLEAGSWCIVVESCDEAGCSVPSGQTCATLPPACP